MADTPSTSTAESSKMQTPATEGLPTRPKMEASTSLEGLQSEKQALVLDTVTQIRKCGLDSILSLPQLVVCGDQSAGKSSVLEALTEIPFPRADNLCTRFATEIILRRGTTDSITIKVIPDPQRPTYEQDSIRAFNESISNFDELPMLIEKAKAVMGIGDLATTRAFARDVLSIEIEGPSRPQLTVVDLPGLIQNVTKGVTESDVELVKQLTEDYINQRRTICLAVISAMNDYANQGILDRVKKADPQGIRSLGIITKPDRLDAGSGSEQAFINLAKNEDVFFNLGWHVLRNRSFQDGDTSFEARNEAEARFFRTSNFKILDKANVGIDNLRGRLSHLLFEHIQSELPQLNEDLEEALETAKAELEMLGASRSSASECRAFMTDRSMKFHELCLAAMEGRYNGDFFKVKDSERFDHHSKASARRLRAMIQKLNTLFSESMTKFGAKIHVISDAESDSLVSLEVITKDQQQLNGNSSTLSRTINPMPKRGVKRHLSTIFCIEDAPKRLSATEATNWVKRAMERSRGRELSGNFNPLLVGELFWEQSSKWIAAASEYADIINDLCSGFLEDLLQNLCPKDLKDRLWLLLQDSMKTRYERACSEIQNLAADIKAYPLNYNHYYTDTLQKLRQDRDENELSAISRQVATNAIDSFVTSKGWQQFDGKSPAIEKATSSVRLHTKVERDMARHTCREILDCLDAIYKVQLKTFIANVTTQVIERHIVRGLELIFSPMVVADMSDEELRGLASEPASVIRQRRFLKDRIAKLESGRKVLRKVMRKGAM